MNLHPSPNPTDSLSVKVVSIAGFDSLETDLDKNRRKKNDEDSGFGFRPTTTGRAGELLIPNHGYWVFRP